MYSKHLQSDNLTHLWFFYCEKVAKKYTVSRVNKSELNRSYKMHHKIHFT